MVSNWIIIEAHNWHQKKIVIHVVTKPARLLVHAQGTLDLVATTLNWLAA